MLPRLGAGALIAALAMSSGAGAARADGPTAARGAPRGAVVVALGDSDAGAAARSLALAVYKEPALRPAIDDATARVLAGEAPADDSPRLAELASLRAALRRPEPGAQPDGGADAVFRRALAGLGSEVGAALVVPVELEAGRPVARALRVSTATFERVEIGATTATDAAGAQRVEWPGAVPSLRALLGPTPGPTKPAPAAASAPLAPKSAAPARDDAKTSSFWSSPWFWAALGGVVAVGATTFIIANAAQGDDVIRMRGRVPQ